MFSLGLISRFSVVPVAVVAGLSILQFGTFVLCACLLLCVDELEGTAAEYAVVGLRGVVCRVLGSPLGMAVDCFQMFRGT